jgi:hypothetical protein
MYVYIISTDEYVYIYILRNLFLDMYHTFILTYKIKCVTWPDINQNVVYFKTIYLI